MINLCIAFCSLRPKNYDENFNNFRELEYLTCLEQIYRIIPKNFEILICENTIDDIDHLNDKNLQIFLKNSNTLLTGAKSNIGLSNKGLGELLMLKNALRSLDIGKYSYISYVTARRFYTCPYVFERTNSLKKEALISNPDFLYLDGKFLKSEKKEMFNDMFFSLATEKMVDYSYFSESFLKKTSFFKFYNKKNKIIGSEQILYKFITLKEIEYEYLDWLGIVRNDWQSNNELKFNNFHIC